MTAMAGGGVSDEQFVEEGLRIVAEGEARSIVLRLLGSVAIRLHSEGSKELYEASERPLTDLDFMSYSSFSTATPGLFESLGYEIDRAVYRHFGRQRQVYWSRETEGLHCDVFFDKLTFCHDVDFVGRLDPGEVTIRPTDLLLEKMQIVQINEKDLKDLAILLREHAVRGNDRDTLDGDYVAGLLSGVWGFWRTFTLNLDKLSTYVDSFDAFPEADRHVVATRVGDLRRLIDDKPKSRGWKLRSKVGTHKKWYRDVEEVSL